MHDAINNNNANRMYLVDINFVNVASIGYLTVIKGITLS